MSRLSELQFGKQYEYEAGRRVAERLWPGSSVVEAQPYADLDFAVTLPGTPPRWVGLIEVKARRMSVHQYESTIVSWRKYQAALAAREYFKVATYAVIVFTDALAVLDLTVTPDTRETIYRRDRPGVGVEHAVYKHSRFVYHNDLLIPLLEVVRAF